MEYIDVHCHLLPGVDDGSQDMDEAMEMLKIAEKMGSPMRSLRLITSREELAHRER